MTMIATDTFLTTEGRVKGAELTFLHRTLRNRVLTRRYDRYSNRNLKIWRMQKSEALLENVTGTATRSIA